MDNGYIRFYDNDLHLISEVVGSYPNRLPDIYLDIDSFKDRMWLGGNYRISLFYKTRYFMNDMLRMISHEHGNFSMRGSNLAEFEDGAYVRCIRYSDLASARGFRSSHIIIQAPETDNEYMFFRGVIYHTWRPMIGYLRSSDNKKMHEHNTLALSIAKSYCDDMINIRNRR